MSSQELKSKVINPPPVINPVYSILCMKTQHSNQKTQLSIGRGSLLTIGVVMTLFLSLVIALQDISHIGLTEVKTVQASTEHPWIIQLGSEFHNPNWLYGFKICPSETIEEGVIAISSDTSDLAIDISSPIEQGTCRTFSVSVTADDPESIFVSIIEAF